MGFGAGFVTGLASSFDKALQMDMKRNQDRLSKAETYMMARQQQKLETAEADERELKKSLKELAAFTGSNNRALMAAEGAGGTAEGINRLLETLREEQSKVKNFDIKKVIDFSGEETLGDERAFTDLVKRFGPRIAETTMPEGFGDTRGLMGKLGFDIKRDVAGDVESTLQIPERFRAPEDDTTVPRARINYGAMTKAIEYEKSMEEKAPSGFDAAHMQLLQKMETAEGEELTALQGQQDELIALEARRKKALAAATGKKAEDSVFSKSSVDSVWKNAFKRTLEPAGVVKSVGDEIEFALEGNEGQYFQGASQAINNVEKIYSPLEDDIMTRRIDQEKITFNGEFDSYITKQQANYRQAVANNTATDTIKYTPAIDTAAIISARPNMSPSEALRDAARAGDIAVGEVVEIERDGVINYVVWTGTSFAGKY